MAAEQGHGGVGVAVGQRRHKDGPIRLDQHILRLALDVIADSGDHAIHRPQRHALTVADRAGHRQARHRFACSR